MFGLFKRKKAKREQDEIKPASVPNIEHSASTNLEGSSKDILAVDEQVLTPNEKRIRVDLSRFDAAPLIAFTATKEMNYGTETDG